MAIRFKNLPFLLNDMKQKQWIIDSFPFKFKEKDYIVILKIYQQNMKKPSHHARAQVEFIEKNNIQNSLIGYIDFFEVKFNNLNDFCTFFDIQRGTANRNLFIDFSEYFAKFIPTQKIIEKNVLERQLIGRRSEGNDPNAIYCYDVRRTGKKEDGSLKQRSIENSNKAQSLRPALYARYNADPNLSFFFSEKEEHEKSDEAIMIAFNSR